MGASWRTSLAGLLTILGAAITFVAIPLLDDDPATVPNWTAFLAAATPGFGLLVARDNKVTSEDAGANRKGE